MQLVKLVCAMLLLTTLAAAAQAATPSFADFDQRAKKGERLTVVFFGASLTWGANATDQTLTSYRADVANYLEEAYPKAHFKCYDGAIGGTGSQLGVFRLNRDVLRRRPDLVFLDFSANDDIYSDNPETLASYESLVRRIILEAHCPVVQVIFPFGWDVKAGTTEKMKRRDAHLAIAKAYHTAVGDAIVHCQQLVKAGKTTIEQIWTSDQVHPGDYGYHLFAEAAWQAYQDAVKQHVTCAAPEKMLNADTYTANARVRISSLGPLPAGWRVGTPSLVAAWHDGLMSRWLDDIVIASDHAQQKNAEGKMVSMPQTVERFKCKFTGSMLSFFGEKTMKSCPYRVYIDGKLHTYIPWGAKEPVAEYDASAKRFGGCVQLWEVIATDLDPKVEHTLEIEPIFNNEDAHELHLESICVAGGSAKVWRE